MKHIQIAIIEIDGAEHRTNVVDGFEQRVVVEWFKKGFVKYNNEFGPEYVPMARIAYIRILHG